MRPELLSSLCVQRNCCMKPEATRAFPMSHSAWAVSCLQNLTRACPPWLCRFWPAPSLGTQHHVTKLPLRDNYKVPSHCKYHPIPPVLQRFTIVFHRQYAFLSPLVWYLQINTSTRPASLGLSSANSHTSVITSSSCNHPESETHRWRQCGRSCHSVFWHMPTWWMHSTCCTQQHVTGPGSRKNQREDAACVANSICGFSIDHPGSCACDLKLC